MDILNACVVERISKKGTSYKAIEITWVDNSTTILIPDKFKQPDNYCNLRMPNP